MNATKQVLFVDDDELALLCYDRLLSRHFTLQKAIGPAEALKAMKRESFAVVASDMRMPGMSGIDLLKKVKEQSPDTVRILLTGNGDTDDGAPSCGDLLFKLLEKPCPTSDLISTIKSALELYDLNCRRVVP